MSEWLDLVFVTRQFLLRKRQISADSGIKFRTNYLTFKHLQRSDPLPHIHGAVESRTIIHANARAEDVSIDVRAVSQAHQGVTMDVAIHPALNRDAIGVYEALDSPLFAHDKRLSMMNNRALDRALNQYLLVCRKLASEYQR